MVDELLILNPHKLSFSEAGLRVMITPHFSPRTRLSMAGRMLISEVPDVVWRRWSDTLAAQFLPLNPLLYIVLSRARRGRGSSTTLGSSWTAGLAPPRPAATA